MAFSVCKIFFKYICFEEQLHDVCKFLSISINSTLFYSYLYIPNFKFRHVYVYVRDTYEIRIHEDKRNVKRNLDINVKQKSKFTPIFKNMLLKVEYYFLQLHGIIC